MLYSPWCPLTTSRLLYSITIIHIFISSSRCFSDWSLSDIQVGSTGLVLPSTAIRSSVLIILRYMYPQTTVYTLSMQIVPLTTFYFPHTFEIIQPYVSLYISSFSGLCMQSFVTYAGSLCEQCSEFLLCLWLLCVPRSLCRVLLLNEVPPFCYLCSALHCCGCSQVGIFIP